MVCSKLTKLFSLSKQTNPGRDVRFSLVERLKVGPAYTRATKSDGFVSEVVASKICLRPGINHVNGSTCYFNDGTKMENVEVIVFGTGFDISEKNYPFLMELPTTPVISPVGRFLRMFDPNYGGSICFVGQGIRPLVGSIPTVCEIQARLFARIVSGKQELPSKEVMEELIELSRKESKRDMSGANEKWEGLVNWIPYMDSIAWEIGCLPSPYFLLRRPRLWFKILIGPMCSFHYRLCGPGSEGKYKEAEDVIMRLPIGTRKRDLLFFAGIQASVSLVTWPGNLLFLIFDWVTRGIVFFGNSFFRPDPIQDSICSPTKETISISRPIVSQPKLSLRRSIFLTAISLFDNQAFVQFRRRCGWIRQCVCGMKTAEIVDGRIYHRPPLVENPEAEQRLKANPDAALAIFRKEYGDAFRFKTASGKTTVVILDKKLAEQVLKSRSVSFYHASYQSKIRFGLKELVQNPKDVQKLTAIFHRTLAGTNNTKVFASRFVALFDERLKGFIADLSEELEGSSSPSACMSLQSIVAKVCFAANVDTLFGKGFYSPELYNDYRTFNEGMGSRSASSVKSENSSDGFMTDKQTSPKDEAAGRIRVRVRQFREQTMGGNGHHGILQDISSKLNPNEEETDLLGLMLLWGANVNMMPTNSWVIATILKHPKLYEALLRERSQDDDILQDRPKLVATIAEVLRIRSGTNMYRIVTKDVEVGGSDGQNTFQLKAGEWIWLYPRAYLHHNQEEYENPKVFDEDRFVGRCPFKTGFSGLRVFGGGVAPCPGKDYSIMMLKSVVDGLLLSGMIDIRLHNPDLPLPEAVSETVASTPPPCEDILVHVATNCGGNNVPRLRIG